MHLRLVEVGCILVLIFSPVINDTDLILFSSCSVTAAKPPENELWPSIDCVSQTCNSVGNSTFGNSTATVPWVIPTRYLRGMI